ncbi:MAG: hypothetical protein RL001_1413 [Pseudomonadota bacterium]|jgi:hypothetical protein|nr:hypothetical protein [Oxalobacteraceae bacterium]
MPRILTYDVMLEGDGMVNAHAVTLRTDMSLTEIHQEIAKLGNITNAPHTKVGLDSRGDEVLYVRNSSVADKLKRLVVSAEMREVNRERLMALISLASRRAGIDPGDQALADVRDALRRGNGNFLDALGSLAAQEALRNYHAGSDKSLF